VGLVDRQGVVGNEIGQRVGHALQKVPEVLLGQDVVEHRRQSLVRIKARFDERIAVIAERPISDCHVGLPSGPHGLVVSPVYVYRRVPPLP
jgi:hypothetical protein